MSPAGTVHGKNRVILLGGKDFELREGVQGVLKSA
jgi:hypothetical protein